VRVLSTLQVILCLFMVVGTLLVFNRNGMAVICNPFDAADKDMAFMLWVFYLSKILDFTDTGSLRWWSLRLQAWRRCLRCWCWCCSIAAVTTP
jgi:hypothetical protein